MRICPQCRTAYPDAGAVKCARDGTRLVDARQFAEAEGDPLLGTTIADRYRINARIGSGGMGTVYRATQTTLGREVALKILRKDLTWDNDTVTRFQREAKATSLLVHPNTVRVFDFGEERGELLYLAMELLEGEVLTRKIEREGPLDVVGAIRIAQQILGSLHEAHTKGIVHRDLKPDNIFLAEVEGHDERVVKVLDFGIAKVVQGDRRIDQLETQAGTVFGTPRYMSPEQAQGKPLDPRSDIYSVGILLYQLLVGRPPFVDDDAVVVMAKHIKEKPVPLREAAPARPIPVVLERLVMRAIEKDRGRRVQSASDFVERLEACVPEVAAEIEARRTARQGAIARTWEQARVPIVVGGLIIACAVAFAGYLISTPGEASAGRFAAPPPETEQPRPDDPSVSFARLASDPPGAEVWHEGTRLGATPLEMRVANGFELRVQVKKDGFAPAPAELVGDGRVRTVRLTPVEIPSSPERGIASTSTLVSPEPERSRTTRRARRARQRTAATSESASEPYQRFE